MLGYSDGDGVGDIDVDGDVDGERARLMISLRFVPAAGPPVRASFNADGGDIDGDGDGVGDVDVDSDRAGLMISLRFVPAAWPPPVSGTCNGLSEQAEVSNGSIHSSKV